jgi:hypothetical protein
MVPDLEKIAVNNLVSKIVVVTLPNVVSTLVRVFSGKN